MNTKLHTTAMRVFKKVSGVSLVILLSGASVAFAALTLSNTSVVSDGALTLTGTGASTMDIGTGLLSIQTTSNGPVTLGTGLTTFGGAVNMSSTLNIVGALTTTSTVRLGSGGNTITRIVTVTSTYPVAGAPAVAPTIQIQTATSSEFTVSGLGFQQGGSCMAGLDSATSTNAFPTMITCRIGTSTAQVQIANMSTTTAITYATGTITVWQIR